MIQHFGGRGVAIFLLLLACLAPAAHAQEETRLQIAAVDISGFPVVRVTLVTADSRSAPADLTNLALRENGIPVTDLSFDNVQAGIDAIFVIDATTGFDEIDDDSGLTRREKVRDSIQRFANEYMNGDGLDRISIVVPGEDRQSGHLLLQNESDPQALIAAINAFEPVRLGPTPLNAMLNLALEEALQVEDDARYQAVLLFSDARRLDEQLSYPLLVAQANDANIPIYGAILGQSADEDELDNMARLTEPAHAFHVHMPQATATDPIYQIWQQQGNPVRLSYNSRQRQSGRNQIAVNLGSSLVGTDFDLSLAAPEVELLLPIDEIHRVGTDPDTPLAVLQPQVQPITINVSWPDGLPRELIEVILLANNHPQPISDAWQENMQAQIELAWDIRDLNSGSVELVVQVLDELGYQGSSMPQTFAVTVDRPLPPTAVPTAESQVLTSDTPSETLPEWQMVAGIGAVLLLAVVVIIWLWRRRANKKSSSTAVPLPSSTVNQPGHSPFELPKIAILEPLYPQSGKRIVLDGASFTIGSDMNSAQIVLQDVSISRLHARIRRQEHTYWLFDEGSTDGVFLNYERLGLAPRELHDGDTVQLGKLTFRFSLRMIPDDENRNDELAH